MKLHFEKNLLHQTQATEAVVGVFRGVDRAYPQGNEKHFVNPEFLYTHTTRYAENILHIQQLNGIKPNVKRNSNIIDIMMETGTGKTYTYTKTIFELNKNYGIFKFVIVVPTLAIKAGTVNFLKSEAAREHFKEQYGKTIELHVVESKKAGKNKKTHMPSAVRSFAEAGAFDKNSIHVMLINAGMINSKTMQEQFDTTLFNEYNVPFEAIAAVKPFMIIDEPHKFSQANKTWENIMKMHPQFILRYGATFKEYENLVYQLTAVDAFNRNLVKGVIGHITEFEQGQNAMVRLVNTDGKEATFELTGNGKKQTFKLVRKESLSRVHPAMEALLIENLSKSKVLLSNGLELAKGDKINPYSYAQTLQEMMIRKAVHNHFEVERKLLKRRVKIKPLTLFFIDNIDEFRKKDGYIRQTLENYVRAEAERLLQTETDPFYRNYLEKTLQNISLTHAGYFSKDNTEKDELIEKEINEILHDKQALLDLNNPRRFIFSKWTLREGWDNPNVFQICKLRSSGSEISKLQEVGRGLRLPVNEYGNRVKDEQFYLNYFVDFTESDFVERLRNEINEKSGAVSMEKVPERLDDRMIRSICEKYGMTEEELLETLDENNVITRTNKFKPGGFAYIKQHFPLIFEGVGSNKVRKATDKGRKVKIRTEKYPELKALWEKLNEKVILEYKFRDEARFKSFFTDFLKENQSRFEVEGIRERTGQIEIVEGRAEVREEESVYDSELTPVRTMKYGDFLRELAKTLHANIKTLHQSFVEAGVDMNPFLNRTTIRIIKEKFDTYLMLNAIDKFGIAYEKVTNSIHPTKFTYADGTVKEEIDSNLIGLFYDDKPVADNYFLEELFYDSELEKENIQKHLREVVVFTKIPKNSIKIPVAGGRTYTPDFAYVLQFDDSTKRLYFVVETKGKDEAMLDAQELQKIRHAEQFFGDSVKIRFKTQFRNKKIEELIREIMQV